MHKLYFLTRLTFVLILLSDVFVLQNIKALALVPSCCAHTECTKIDCFITCCLRSNTSKEEMDQKLFLTKYCRPLCSIVIIDLHFWSVYELHVSYKLLMDYYSLLFKGQMPETRNPEGKRNTQSNPGRL